jgi:hypothetical protein
LTMQLCFIICSMFVCLIGYYIQLQYIINPTKTIYSMKERMAGQQSQQIHQGM